MSGAAFSPDGTRVAPRRVDAQRLEAAMDQVIMKTLEQGRRGRVAERTSRARIRETDAGLPRPSDRRDVDIAQAVRQALDWATFMPSRRIRATVLGGVVTLEGKVEYYSQSYDAAHVVRRVDGVREVKNLIVAKADAPR